MHLDKHKHVHSGKPVTTRCKVSHKRCVQYVWACTVLCSCKVEWGMKKLHRCQVNLHKQGAMSRRMKEEMWNWTSTHREITTGGCIVHLKAVKTRREQDESTSEDNSALQHGDSRMHSTVTKKHHLDRVKTSEVTIAMCPFVCVCVRFSLAMLRYSAATSSPSPCIGIINSLWFTTPGQASAHCVFIMFWLINKTEGRHCVGLELPMANYHIWGQTIHIDHLNGNPMLV